MVIRYRVYGKASTDADSSLYKTIAYRSRCNMEFVEQMTKFDKSAFRSGRMFFEDNEDELLTVTEYVCNRKLSTAEKDDLVKFTKDHWINGIGKGYAQTVACWIGEDPVIIQAGKDDEPVWLVEM